MRVAVVGQGYVGLTITAASLGAGHRVVGFDLSETVIASLKAGKSHIEGIPDSVIADGLRSGNFEPTSESRDLDGADVVVIAVPTPLGVNSLPDLSALEAASDNLGKVLTKPSLIINESTSYPGTLRDVIYPRVSSSGVVHRYAISPERVDPGNENYGWKNTPRVVAGLSEEATKAAVHFYETFCDDVIAVSSPEVAEAAKLFENTFRFINIGLVNEFSQMLAKMGIPVDETLRAAATKPYGFMPFHPNVGIGGHCIPVDPFYLQERAREFGFSSKYIEVSDQVNKSMPRFIVDRLTEEHGRALEGVRVKVIGVSYKPNISDTRESPAEEVVHELQKRGAKVIWHDPLVGSWLGQKSSGLDSGADIGLALVAHENLDMSKWNGGKVYSVNRNPKFPDWIPLISVTSKF